VLLSVNGKYNNDAWLITLKVCSVLAIADQMFNMPPHCGFVISLSRYLPVSFVNILAAFLERLKPVGNN
jgi:hypothetical protein